MNTEQSVCAKINYGIVGLIINNDLVACSSSQVRSRRGGHEKEMRSSIKSG